MGNRKHRIIYEKSNSVSKPGLENGQARSETTAFRYGLPEKWVS
jgi:hypothetical protein